MKRRYPPAAPRRPPIASARLVAASAALVLVAATLARAFGAPPSLFLLTVGAALVLIVAGYPRINRKLCNTSFIQFGVALLVLPFAHGPRAAVSVISGLTLTGVNDFRAAYIAA